MQSAVEDSLCCIAEHNCSRMLQLLIQNISTTQLAQRASHLLSSCVLFGAVECASILVQRFSAVGIHSAHPSKEMLLHVLTEKLPDDYLYGVAPSPMAGRFGFTEKDADDWDTPTVDGVGLQLTASRCAVLSLLYEYALQGMVASAAGGDFPGQGGTAQPSPQSGGGESRRFRQTRQQVIIYHSDYGIHLSTYKSSQDRYKHGEAMLQCLEFATRSPESPLPAELTAADKQAIEDGFDGYTRVSTDLLFLAACERGHWALAGAIVEELSSWYAQAPLPEQYKLCLFLLQSQQNAGGIDFYVANVGELNEEQLARPYFQQLLQPRWQAWPLTPYFILGVLRNRIELDTRKGLWHAVMLLVKSKHRLVHRGVGGPESDFDAILAALPSSTELANSTREAGMSNAAAAGSNTNEPHDAAVKLGGATPS